MAISRLREMLGGKEHTGWKLPTHLLSLEKEFRCRDGQARCQTFYNGRDGRITIGRSWFGRGPAGTAIVRL